LKNVSKTDRAINEALKAFAAPYLKGFSPDEFCFRNQLEFIRSPARFKTACCGGRAGKTVADAAYLIAAANSEPRSVALYITLSRSNAKKLVWPELLEINRQFKLGAKVNESDLSLQFANKSFIYASGASRTDEIEKFRGLPLVLCIIDEVQSFKSYVRKLIDDVVSKRLFDFAGTLALTGTPGPIPSGYFFDACQNAEYAHFHWTMFDNPWIELKSGRSPASLLDEELKRKGVGLDDPTIQREVYGKWTYDPNALVFRYNKDINDFVEPPRDVLDGLRTIIGVDIGFDDADAICVLGWSDKLPKAYLLEEDIKTKQGITELANAIEEKIQRYNPIRVVMDCGGLGKKIAEEIRKRFAIPVIAAEKTRKFEYIELLNDAMRTGRFMAKQETQFVADSMLLEWDRDVTVPKIKESYHSDICDAVLYAFRESLHWLYEPQKPMPTLGTAEWRESERKKMEDDALETFAKMNDRDAWPE
jgi:hypothetical protein